MQCMAGESGGGAILTDPQIWQEYFLEKRTEAERDDILLFTIIESKPSSSSKNFQPDLAQIGSWPFSFHLKFEKRPKTSRNIHSLFIIDKARQFLDWVRKTTVGLHEFMEIILKLITITIQGQNWKFFYSLKKKIQLGFSSKSLAWLSSEHFQLSSAQLKLITTVFAPSPRLLYLPPSLMRNWWWLFGGPQKQVPCM